MRALPRRKYWLKWAKRLFWPSTPSPDKSHRTALSRVKFCILLSGFCFFGLSAKAIYLTTGHEAAGTPGYASSAPVTRGAITDREGRILAHTVPVMVLHADPAEVMNVRETAAKLARLLPHKSEHQLIKELSRKSRYVELDRKLTPQRHAAVLELGLPGIHTSPATTRLYPNGREAAHILGQMNKDGRGIAGLEKSLNPQLSAGHDVALSIDLGVQAIVRAELNRQIKLFEAIGGVGLVLDIQTGELVSLVSLPDYDPNHYQLAETEALFNNATKGVFEMGSIFKVLNTAIALETGVSNAYSSFDVTKPLRVARHMIRDYHPVKRPLNLSEVLVYSSNIGSAKVAEAFGPQVQKDYMGKLGLLERSSLELPETASPLIPSNWGRIASMTISYGHGMSVSPVHASAALAAAAGYGEYITPTLLKRSPGEVFERQRIFSDDTVRYVRSMMRLVVTHKEGTANFADAEGYVVGAKTGTAEKIKNKRYDKGNNRVSLIASFPIHKPRYLVFVMVDEPQPQKFSYGYATAGWVTAPLAKRIIEHISPVLNVHPVAENAPEIGQNLVPELLKFKKGAIVASF